MNKNGLLTGTIHVVYARKSIWQPRKGLSPAGDHFCMERGKIIMEENITDKKSWEIETLKRDNEFLRARLAQKEEELKKIRGGAIEGFFQKIPQPWRIVIQILIVIIFLVLWFYLTNGGIPGYLNY